MTAGLAHSMGVTFPTPSPAKSAIVRIRMFKNGLTLDVIVVFIFTLLFFTIFLL